MNKWDPIQEISKFLDIWFGSSVFLYKFKRSLNSSQIRFLSPNDRRVILVGESDIFLNQININVFSLSVPANEISKCLQVSFLSHSIPNLSNLNNFILNFVCIISMTLPCLENGSYTGHRTQGWPPGSVVLTWGF